MTSLIRRTLTLGLRQAPAVVTLTSMIATPLCRRGGPGRRHLAAVVIGGLAATTAASAGSRWRPEQVAGTAGVIAGATGLAEWIGSTTGLPFGRYRYSGILQPTVAGVPVLVPAAWFAMAIPAREAAHGALGRASTPGRRIALGAFALMAWDLFLDPQMVGEGYWVWHRCGRYRGIPWSNFVGWLLVSAGVMAALERTLPAQAVADAALIGEYTVIGVMETVGFARFFGDSLVALVGGSAMGPLAVAALINRRRVG